MAHKKVSEKTFWYILVGLVVIAGVLILLRHFLTRSSVTSGSSASTTPQTASATASALPGLQPGAAPWPNGVKDLRARLAAIGLPALPEEGTKLHIHQHLDIYLDGVPLQIPAGIGIDEAAGFISPLHVHDLTGIVHVESPVIQTFTLGQVFDVWGVQLSSTCIGGYCATADKSLQVYVNGSLYAGDPRSIELTPHEEIAIVYGTIAETPKVIPASYAFPTGY